jgi:hypothetical protein
MKFESTSVLYYVAEAAGSSFVIVMLSEKDLKGEYCHACMSYLA